jgi:hypothetical protein
MTRRNPQEFGRDLAYGLGDLALRAGTTAGKVGLVTGITAISGWSVYGAFKTAADLVGATTPTHLPAWSLDFSAYSDPHHGQLPDPVTESLLGTVEIIGIGVLAGLLWLASLHGQDKRADAAHKNH